ncbi:MAG: sugar transferase [Phycisphaerae bacterium]|nr:sugar transferase [Phycisphaerae bacterium]
MTFSSAWRQIRLAIACGDVASVFIAYVAADVIRTRWWLGQPWPETLPGFNNPVEVHYWTLAVLPIVWPFVLRGLGWYTQRWRPARWYISRAIVGGFVLSLILAGLALFVRREAFPRMQIVLFGGLLPATAVLIRGITGLAGHWLAARQRRHVLIVGTGREAVRLRRLLRSSALGRPTVLGHLSFPAEGPAEDRTTGAVLGDVSALGELLDSRVVDEVFFAVSLDRLPAALPYVRLCEEVGISSHVLAESIACHSTPQVEDFRGVPLLAYSPTRHSPELLFIKRLFDLLIATVGIIVTGPIMLICAVAIRWTSPGPFLFRQLRTGLNGRLFYMLKFRTMQPDAAERRAEIAHLNEADGPAFKITDDPRVTRLGAFLRRFSLDELPQLFNVLAGEMSIVGPRPPVPEEVAQYDRWQRRRLSMRPGLTCLWQIRGRRRHQMAFDEWMRLDLYYIDHWSLKLDFLIMFKTVVTVLSGSGA